MYFYTISQSYRSCHSIDKKIVFVSPTQCFISILSTLNIVTTNGMQNLVELQWKKCLCSQGNFPFS